AVALAKSGKGPTCLVDAYTQFGDVGTTLNVRPTQTLVDLSGMREIDLDVIESASVVHSSGLHVILGSLVPEALDALSASRLEEVFGTLRKRYRFIVVDVPNFLYA